MQEVENRDETQTSIDNSPEKNIDSPNQTYRYELKNSLLTETEKKYLTAIKQLLPNDYYIQPQVNLASIIEKTDGSKFCTELFRNIDACIFDKNYKPCVLIEINDSTHNESSRAARDKKVKFICEEAGIPIVSFWTSYGINVEYFKKKLLQAIEEAKHPVRIAHMDKVETQNTKGKKNAQGGCYIATSVYGSYDCPEVWTLRRFRDYILSVKWYGRAFIKIYYAISPKLVKYFGNSTWFKKFWKQKLDFMVKKLQDKGLKNTPYRD